MPAALKLFDLAGADAAVRFSPYCWRTRLALAHKGLPVETIPWRFTEKEAIAVSGQGKVPVLIDGERCVHDSWAIAEYLEAAYPDRPSLFGSPEARALARFVNCWTSEAIHPALGRIIAPGLPAIVAEKDRAYFVSSREARFGMSLAALADERDKWLASLRKRWGRCGPRSPSSRSSPARPRTTPTTSSSAPSNGRGWRAQSRSSPPTTPRSAPGANACSTPTAASPARRRARFESPSPIAPTSRSRGLARRSRACETGLAAARGEPRASREENPMRPFAARGARRARFALVAAAALACAASFPARAAGSCVVGDENCPLVVKMAPGATTVTATGSVTGEKPDFYMTFVAKAGQKLTLHVVGGNLKTGPGVPITFPDGGGGGVFLDQPFVLPQTGAYVVFFHANTMSEGPFGRFRATFEIR